MDAELTAVNAQLINNVQNPLQAANGSLQATQHQPDDVIEVYNHLAAKKGARKPHRGLRFNKLSPPGTV